MTDEKKDKNKKEEGFYIKLSKTEKIQLQQNAKDANCTVSELIRRLAIYKNDISLINIDMKPIEKILTSSIRQSGNLNQLMRFLNMNGLNALGNYSEDDIQKILDETKKALMEIRKLVADIRKGELNI